MTPALRAIAIAIALALLLIPPAAAISETIEISDYEIESINEEQTKFRSLSGSAVPKLELMLIQNIEQFTNPFSVIWAPSPPRYASFRLVDKSIYSDDSPVTYRYSSRGGPVLGTGRISYYKDVDGAGGDYMVLTFETFHADVIGADTGVKAIYFTDIDPDFNIDYFGFDDSNYPDNTFVSLHLTGYITTNLKTDFRQQIKYNTDNQQTSITVTRALDHSYESRIIISGHNKSTPYTDTVHKTNSVAVTVPTSDAPFSIDIYSPTFDRWYNRTILQSASPDPEPVGPFSLTLSPASVQVGETVTATLLADPDAPHYSYLVWSCIPDDHPDMASWSYRIQDENGTWYERAANGDEIPISAADALTYQATPAYPGGHHIGVTIYDHHPPCQGLEQRATLAKSFEAVHKPSSSPVRIQVVDERTGALIAGSNIQVIDSQLPPFEGTGINPIIDTTLPQGSEMFYLQRNAYDEPRYRIFADADGYRQVTENQWFSVNPATPNTVTTVKVQMAAAAAPPEDPNNAYVTFRIRDEDGNPVKEARVTLDRWMRAALGTRPVQFEVPRGATYQYTVEPIDAGLYPATGSVMVGAEDRYEVNVVLLKTPPATPGPGDDPGGSTPAPTGWGPGQWTPDPGGALGDNARSAAKQTLLEGLEMGQGLFMLCILMIMLTVIRRGGR